MTTIYEHEVAPACAGNLLVLPGGVWGAFDRTWLVDSIDRHVTRRARSTEWPLVRRWKTRAQTAMTRGDWERVRALL